MFKYKLWHWMASLISIALALSANLLAEHASAHQFTVADAVMRTVRAPYPKQATNDTKVFLPLVQRIIPPLRIDSAASTSYIDAAGNTWVADTGFIDGQTSDLGNISTANTSDPRIYQTERYKLTGYALPTVNGNYTVRLHFAETFYTSAGKRIFSVNVEGTPITNIDVFAEAGGLHIALIKTVNVTVADGQLNLSFTSSVAETMIDGIEVIPQ
jgi:hypothetical protein